MSTSNKSKRAWDKENTKVISLKLNKKTDKDILEWLDKQGNKQGTLKSLIRKEMETE